jgi:hypothetical protein
LIRNADTTTKVYANPIFRMPLTEAKKKNIQTTNASNFYRGTEVEVWENLLRQWEEDWITSYMAEKHAQSM